MKRSEKVKEIQAEMMDLVEKIHKQSDGTLEQKAVNTIVKEMENIVAKSGAPAKPEYQGRRYKQLERSLLNSERVAADAKKTYQEMKAKLSRLSYKLAVIQMSLLPSVEDFSTDLDENIFREAMQPWVDMINPFFDSLKRLEERHAELEEGLPSIVPDNKAMSEDELLNDDIGAHLAAAIQQEDQELEFDVACGLLDRLEAMIKMKRDQVSYLQACYAEALRRFVDSYTLVGLRKNARDLETMFDRASRYGQSVSDICSKISAEIGFEPRAVFSTAWGTNQTRTKIIFTEPNVLFFLKKFIKTYS